MELKATEGEVLAAVGDFGDLFWDQLVADPIAFLPYVWNYFCFQVILQQVTSRIIFSLNHLIPPFLYNFSLQSLDIRRPPVFCDFPVLNYIITINLINLVYLVHQRLDEINFFFVVYELKH